jgi:hypothetical protein
VEQERWDLESNMAERIKWTTEFTPEDPRFYQADTTNPNINISASKYDPTDPTADVENPNSASARYNEFLKTANIGDTFDFGKGITNKFTGFNKMGTPMIQTIQSDALTNWRDTISGATTEEDAINKLKNAGFDDQMAFFLVKKSGTDFLSETTLSSNKKVVSTKKNTDGTTTVTYSDNTSSIIPADGIVPKIGDLATSLSTDGNVIPASTGPTLASDVFKQTLSIFFGASEMAKPWVNELYKAVSKFYKAGATSEESFNMAVLDSEKNPALADFTKRFKGIYSLQKMKQAGRAVTVPTIAEYFATESKMGDVLKQSNLGDLANEDFLGDVLAKGVSATEFANRITAIFDRIDNAPKDIKDTLSRFFPTVDRISLAKAIALGDKGAKELQNQVAGYEVLSAAEKQGLGANQIAGGTTAETAYQYALGGETYDTALTKFGTVAAMLPTVNKLTQVYGEPMLGPSGIQEAVFGKSAKQIKTLEDLVKKEEATYSAKSGVSQISLASQRRAAGLI